MADAGGGLYLVAAKTALEVGEIGTNQVNVLIYKRAEYLKWRPICSSTEKGVTWGKAIHHSCLQ